jgi:hypothetical protein
MTARTITLLLALLGGALGLAQAHDEAPSRPAAARAWAEATRHA